MTADGATVATIVIVHNKQGPDCRRCVFATDDGCEVYIHAELDTLNCAEGFHYELKAIRLPQPQTDSDIRQV